MEKIFEDFVGGFLEEKIGIHVKNENRYYPDELNVYSIKNIVKNTDKQVYFVFTKFNSGFEYAKFEFLKEILSENYNEIYSCELDSNVNFIYVSNIE